MVVETDDMRLEFLKDFGVTDATFTDVSAGSSSTITALFQTDYLLEETGGEVGVETSTPIITARSSDIPNVFQGDTIAISGTRRIFPAGTFLMRPGQINITIGSPLSPSGKDWQATLQLRDRAYSAIEQEVDETNY